MNLRDARKKKLNQFMTERDQHRTEDEMFRPVS